MTRDINTQQHEISNLTGKVMDLKLELKRSIQEKREMQVEFKKYKRNFEREIEGYQRKSMQTINNAEDHLVQYNDEWTKRIEDERQQWIEKVRMREELSEHNIMALQNQFSEAHQFYTDHITKVRKQTMKEEAKRIKVEEELEETKALFLREQAARKALTNQLKKERKWREKCMNVTKTVLNLKSENNLDNEEAAATVSSSPHPSPPASPYIEDPILSMDPSSVAYLQAVAEFERTGKIEREAKRRAGNTITSDENCTGSYLFSPIIPTLRASLIAQSTRIQQLLKPSPVPATSPRPHQGNHHLFPLFAVKPHHSKAQRTMLSRKRRGRTNSSPWNSFASGLFTTVAFLPLLPFTLIFPTCQYKFLPRGSPLPFGTPLLPPTFHLGAPPVQSFPRKSRPSGLRRREQM